MKEMNKEIDLKEIWNELKAHGRLLASSCILPAVIAYFVCAFLMKPVYNYEINMKVVSDDKTLHACVDMLVKDIGEQTCLKRVQLLTGIREINFVFRGNDKKILKEKADSYIMQVKPKVENFVFGPQREMYEKVLVNSIGNDIKKIKDDLHRKGGNIATIDKQLKDLQKRVINSDKKKLYPDIIVIANTEELKEPMKPRTVLYTIRAGCIGLILSCTYIFLKFTRRKCKE